MPIAVGQTSKGRSASATTIASGAVNTQVNGSTFVVGIIWATGASFTSFVDNKGNTYTQTGVDREVTAADGTHARLYRCENGIGGTGHTVTLTISAAVALSVFFVEILGARLASFDQQNSQTDAASPFTSANITTTQAAEMLVSYIVGNSGSNPATNAESTGFTIQAGAEETNGSTFWTGCLATRIVAATGTYNSSFTETGSTSAAVFIASFKENPPFGAWRQPSVTGPGKHPGPRQFGPIPRGSRSQASPDVTVALTGSLVTFSTGTLIPAIDKALVGLAHAWSAGTLAASIDKALAGTQYTWSTGTITPSTGGDVTVALTGQLVNYAAGTLAPSAAVALVGSSEAYSTGTVAVDHAQSIAGVVEAYSTGVLTPSTTISLNGELYLYSTGTLTASAGGDVTVALTGIQYGWQTGAVTPSGGDSGQQPSGGYAFLYEFESHRERRRRRKQIEDERQREADDIQAEIDRDIAKLLRAQEAKDAERADLSRIQAMADQYAGTRQEVPRSIAASLLKAQEERSKNALEQLQREMERMLEEEEAHIVALLLMDD